jgi:hypothetical protein
MQEVVAQDSFVYVMRAAIIDIANVVPLAEWESGLLNMCGATNSFIIRHSLRNRTPEKCTSNYYFVSHPIEPLSEHLFHSLDYLAKLLRKNCFTTKERLTLVVELSNYSLA